MLADETPIVVGNKHGHTVTCDYVQAQPCGMIAVHTVHMTHKVKRDYGRAWHLEPIEEKPIKVNYTAIQVAA